MYVSGDCAIPSVNEESEVFVEVGEALLLNNMLLKFSGSVQPKLRNRQARILGVVTQNYPVIHSKGQIELKVA